MLRFVLLFAACASAQNLCSLVGTEIYAQDREKTFLGIVSDNPYASESIMNKFGVYGSKYSTTSILNEFGTFGSEFSTYSPFNAFTTTPPILVDDGVAIAYLSKNKFVGGTTVDPDALLITLAQGCGGIYNPPVVTKPDLVIDSLEVYISDNRDSVYIYFIIANMGSTQTPIFSVVAGTMAGADTIAYSPLNANMYYSEMLGYRLIEDTTAVLVMADFYNQVAEASEDNNVGGGVFLTPRKTTSIQKPLVRRRAISGRIPKGFDVLGRAIRP